MRLFKLGHAILWGVFLAAGWPPLQVEAQLTVAEFTEGNRESWYLIDSDTSTLSVETEAGQLGSLPELNFAAKDPSSLQSIATHFPAINLKEAGDSITLQFDVRHNHEGFVNRGFRFGLFDSNETRFTEDGDYDLSPVSLDDNGYFAILDLGSKTTADSVVIRESSNHTTERLWNGTAIASDDNDTAPDLLMLTRYINFTYTLTLTRNSDGNVDIVLKNNISKEHGAMQTTSSVTPTLSFDTLYFATSGSTANFAIDNVLVTSNLSSSQNPSIDIDKSSLVKSDGIDKKKVQVGVYVDVCAGQSVRKLLLALDRYKDVSVTLLKAVDIQEGKLAGLDVLMQPGGSAGVQGRNLGTIGREQIRKFTHDGGGYVGFCAGSYLASTYYSWSLNILDADIVDLEHWARGTGTVELALTNSGKEILNTKENEISIYYGQGPLFAPGNQSDVEDYETVATYQTEIAKKGAPEGVMVGTTAIARGNYGNGRVFCFSPHPELTEGMEHLVYYAIENVKRNRVN